MTYKEPLRRPPGKPFPGRATTVARAQKNRRLQGAGGISGIPGRARNDGWVAKGFVLARLRMYMSESKDFGAKRPRGFGGLAPQ